MATAIKLQNSATAPRAYPQGGYKDMSTSTATLASANDTCTVTAGVDVPTPFFYSAFWSERIATGATISGAVSIALRGFKQSTWTSRIRAELYKITGGGSDLETFIGRGDTTANLTTSNAAYTITFTPTTPVAVGPGERLILRWYAIPDPTSGTFGTGTGFAAELGFGPASVSFDTTMTLTETLTFTPNVSVLVARRTATIGIGAFKDLLLTYGVTAYTTGVTTTTAGGTEIPMTTTAGGAVLEWISPRLLTAWMVDAPAHVGLYVGAFESAATVNATSRAKVFRRQPDGTETELWRGDASAEYGVTFGFVTAIYTLTANIVVTPTAVQEDDRIVVRVYVINFGGTMAAGTVTVGYDNPADLTSPNIKVTIRDAPFFKAEGDPARVFTVPGGMTTGGVGN